MPSNLQYGFNLSLIYVYSQGWRPLSIKVIDEEAPSPCVQIGFIMRLVASRVIASGHEIRARIVTLRGDTTASVLFIDNGRRQAARWL